MFYTPRFSYGTLKVRVLGCSCMRYWVRGRVCTTGVWHWVGTGRGYTGVIPTQPARARGAVPYQRSGPRRTCRVRSGWVRGCGRYREYGEGGGDGYIPTLRARSVSLQEPSLGYTLRNAASWPIRARFSYISCKVSQNRRVSPKK